MQVAGAEQEASLRSAGFGDAEIASWKADTSQHLQQAGFSNQEIGSYFGTPTEPDLKSVGKYVSDNLKAQTPATPGTDSGLSTPATTPRPADSMLDAIEAGWQMSTVGLIKRNKLPDTVLPEHAGMAMRIASQAATLAGDVPAMVAGGVFGGIAGSEVPIVGNTIGAAGGAWAAPAAIRTAYIQHLQKGDIKDFGDFWERAGAVSWEALKAGTTGILTEGVGGLTGSALARTAAPVALQTTGKLGAQLATMTTVGKAMEGQIPKPEDFVEGALLLAGLHGAVKVATEMPTYAKNITTKLQDIYAKTGLKPDQVLTEAQQNPVLKQEILSENKNIPPSLKSMIDPPQKGQEGIAPQGPEPVDAKVPDSLAEPHPTLGEGFAPESHLTIERSEAEKRVEARIGEEDEKKMTFSQVYTQVLDRLNPINKLSEKLASGEKLAVEEDPFALFRLAGAADAKTDAFIKFGPRSVDGEKLGIPGLKKIFNDSGDPRGFLNYAIAAHSLELEKVGKLTGVPQDAAREFVEANKGKFQKSLDQLVEFQNAGLKYLKDSGVISGELHDKSIERWQNYVPFNRIGKAGLSAESGSGTNPIKEIFGSDLQLKNPLESIIRNSFAYTKIADENRAKLALVDLAKKVGASDLVERVETPKVPITVSEAEVEKFMRERGIVGDAESFEIYRPLSQPLKNGEIAVMRDGKREVYQVGEDVAKAIDADPFHAPALLKWASIPTKILRTGAVDTVDFLARHAMRDTTNAYIYSENGFKPIFSSLYGLKEFFTNGEVYKDWLMSGGAMSNFTSLDRDYIQKDIYKLSKETGLIDKTTNLLKSPIELFKAGLDLMHYLAEGVVSAPRIAEFQLARERGKSDLEAGYDSRNVTIDNQRMGAADSIRVISMLHAFWNTRIQGLDRMVQAFKDKPAETMTKYALSTTLPATLLWWMNKDDPRYRDAPQWEKDLFYFIPTPWAMLRVPKAFEGGLLFGSLPERALDGLYHSNPDAFKGFGRVVFEAAAPNPFMPDVARPMVEQFANRSILTGGNLVSDSLKQVAPEYQYNPYTSEAAKMIGKMVSYVPVMKDMGPGNITLASPIIVQNYVRAWAGGMGDYALALADKALEASGVTPPNEKPASSLSDIPFIKAFVVRYPTATSQTIQDFYDNFGKASTAMETATHLAKSGDIRAWENYMNSAEGQEHFINLKGIQKGLGSMNQMVQKTYLMTDMKPDEKRQAIDGLYLQMIESARLGNQLFREMEKASKAKK